MNAEELQKLPLKQRRKLFATEVAANIIVGKLKAAGGYFLEHEEGTDSACESCAIGAGYVFCKDFGNIESGWGRDQAHDMSINAMVRMGFDKVTANTIEYVFEGYFNDRLVTLSHPEKEYWKPLKVKINTIDDRTIRMAVLYSLLSKSKEGLPTLEMVEKVDKEVRKITKVIESVKEG